MSQEINAFVNSKNRPNKDTWQKSITNLGFPLTLHPDLDLSKDSGFSPCKLADEESGFEIYVDEAGEMLAYYPHLKDDVTGRDIVISFRWGSDSMELACILCAVAALVNDFGAVAYFPDNDFLYDFSGLLKEANDLVADIAGEKIITGIKKSDLNRYLKNEVLPHFGPNWRIYNGDTIYRKQELIMQGIYFVRFSTKRRFHDLNLSREEHVKDCMSADFRLTGVA